jgi:methionyl-tRNA formyltransferase
MAGDECTGVTIMQMEAGLDTGPMLLKRVVEIEDKNAAQLTEELARLGATMMVEVLADLPGYEPIEQPEEGVTYAAKISKEEARIDWTRPAAELVRQVQGLAPFPGAWFEANGERIKLLAADVAAGHGEPGEVIDDQLAIGCGNGALRPTLVQRAGKGAMSAEELLRGFAIARGTVLR